MAAKQDRIQQSITIAHMYYEQELSQNEIAKRMSISRPTVSRLLQFAKQTGLVRIQIMDPLASAEDLQAQLQTKYQISKVLVAPVPMANSSVVLETVGQTAANYLDNLVTDHDIVGIGWGKTIHAIATHLNVNEELSDVQVVQLKGSVSYSKYHTYAYESINAFANAFHSIPQYLPLPVIFDQKLTKNLAEKERHIQQLIELGKKANIAVFTVGTVRDSALVFQLNYFTDAEMKFLQQHAVGDVFSRFIDARGQIVSTEINQRTIGIELDELKKKEHSILVASGTAKVSAIDAALTGHYANELITDQQTAQQLLDYQK